MSTSKICKIQKALTQKIQIVRTIASRDRLYAKLKRNTLNSKEKNKLKSNLKTCNALLSKLSEAKKSITIHVSINVDTTLRNNGLQ